VTETPLTAEQENNLRNVIHEALGHPFALRFTYFEGQIPRAANGKFEEFVCAVN